MVEVKLTVYITLVAPGAPLLRLTLGDPTLVVAVRV